MAWEVHYNTLDLKDGKTHHRLVVRWSVAGYLAGPTGK
jgi:hypothetical protein